MTGLTNQHDFITETRLFSVSYDSTKITKADMMKMTEKAGNFTIINWKYLPSEDKNKIETKE